MFELCIISTTSICDIPFKIDRKINTPIYIYYELQNFYINHKEFVTSRSYPQLRGEEHIDRHNNSKICKGGQYIWQIFNNDTSKYKTKSGNPLKANDFANPCGLIAKSFFNGMIFNYFRYLHIV